MDLSDTNLQNGREKKDPLIGIVLQKRFEIVELHSSEGAYGQIYTGQDFLTKKEVIIKITQHPEMNYKEHTIMTSLNQDQF